MIKRLLATAFGVALVALVFVSPTSAQTKGPNLRQYLSDKLNRGIDDGIVKRAPVTGDEKMAHRAPEHIDDGIIMPGRVLKRYAPTVKPRVKRK